MYVLNSVLFCMPTETLRLYPPASNLIRSATINYQIPETNVTIPKGTMVFIPVYAIHHDAEYYPNPEKFDPERFSPEKVKERHNMAHLPFGEGPRNCIGSRFGLMQTKVGLITLLRYFQFNISSKTIIPLVISPKGIILTSKGGFYLKLKKML